MAIDKLQKQININIQEKANLDNLTTIKEKKNDELTEYKKSLIYEYVTGKKEVIV